jgi:hypothetical protein
MQINKDTYEIQSGLAAYCRTNVAPHLPGITEGRIHQYRRLVYNIVDDTFEGAFPITRKLLNDEEWHTLINSFFMHHACQTPSVWKLPFEFYEYVAESELAIKQQYPFLTDLLYFEWLEIDVHTMPDVAQEECRETGSWLTDRIIINKEFKLIRLSYPVHQLAPEALKENNSEGNYFVLIYREPQNGDVQFFDLSPLYAVLITQLSETGKDLESIIPELCALFQVERSANVDASIISFLEQLKQKEFVLGFADA